MSIPPHQHTKTIVMMGEDGTGKATLMGYLMYRCGGVDMLLLEGLQRDGLNKYEQVLAYYKTNDIKPSFQARHAKILLQEATVDAGRVDILVYVLDSSPKTPPAKISVEHTEASSVIVVVNKMDACDWSVINYLEAIEQNRSHLQQQGLILEKCPIIPISALYGENIIERTSKSPWYLAMSPQHRILIEAIDAASED